MSQQNLTVSLLGFISVMILWMVSASYLAPRMQSHVQRQGDELLAPMDLPLASEADGIHFHVRGASSDTKTRFRVYEQLAALHPIVDVTVEIKIVDAVQEPAEPIDVVSPGGSALGFNNITEPTIDDSHTRCERLRELDPNIRCR